MVLTVRTVVRGGGVVGVYANRFSNVKVNLAKIYNEKKEKKKKTTGAVKIKGGSV